MQRSFLGQVMTSRPCPTCQGFGEVIPSPCHECSGQGRVRSRRTMKVRIPAGVDTGTRIHLAGEGEVGPGGGPAGDLYVELRVAEHETFTRRGDDLHASVAVPMTAAALGVTHLRHEGRGDLVIHVDVRTPTKLDAEQEQLLRDLARLRDEEQPDGELHDVDSGFVGRLRHAFKR